MRYFEIYPDRLDDATLAAWDTELAKLSAHLSGVPLADCCGKDVFASFVVRYRELTLLPRRTRRLVRRELAASRQVNGVLQRRLVCFVSSDLQRQLTGSIAGAALVLALCQDIAGAATINVTTNVPVIAADGRCSLVEAVINANDDAATHSDCVAGSGPDTIVLPGSSTHSVKTALASYYGASALPLVTSAITIEGNGGRIARPKNKNLFRLVTVTNSGNLTLRNVTLSGGFEYFGGAAFNAGSLTITASTISGGHAAAGGGVFNAPTGELTITGSAVSKNTAGYGGGLFNYLGSTLVENSTISGNRGVQGGGLYNLGGEMEVEDSVISQNRAGDGGGFWVSGGNVVIRESEITKHSVSSHAAGMWISDPQFGIGASAPTVTIQNSHIHANKSRFSAGGILQQSSGTLTIQNSTISENRAGSGAGLRLSAGQLSIDNSTISGNRAGDSGGGIWSQRTLTVTNSTITGNSARSGGGMYQSLEQIILERSIVSGNKANSGSEVQINVSNGGSIVADDFNLFGVSGNAGVVGFNPGATDVVPSVPIAAILGPLANNGGPTPTHALVAGSPAIDAVPGAHSECSGTDQRGVARPQGVGCDSGAFEK